MHRKPPDAIILPRRWRAIHGIDIRFKLVELYVADPDASARFYGDVLGFRIGHAHHEAGKLDWCQLLQGNHLVLHLRHRPDRADVGFKGALLFESCELDALQHA